MTRERAIREFVFTIIVIITIAIGIAIGLQNYFGG